VMDRTREHAHGRVEIRTLKGRHRRRPVVPARRPGDRGHPPCLSARLQAAAGASSPCTRSPA
jgi:hypothetical protein